MKKKDALDLTPDVLDEVLDYGRYRLAYHNTALFNSQRWELVQDIKDEDVRRLAACYVPGLTDEQKKILRGEQDES